MTPDFEDVLLKLSEDIHQLNKRLSNLENWVHHVMPVFEELRRLLVDAQKP